MKRALAESYAECEALARRHAGNFYPAFRLLPSDQRLAMCALYAFMRRADDLSDDSGSVAAKRRALADWRLGLRQALRGEHTHAIHPALHHAITTFRIPSAYLEAVLDGVEMDLEPVALTSFEELHTYCYHVASVVGLACIHVWGFSRPEAKVYAEQAGLAFQLTNILRDLKEDAERGRVYVPREDLTRFGYDPSGLRTGVRDDAFRALMHFEIARARQYYDAADSLLPLLAAPGRAVYSMMAGTYRSLLDEIERRDYDVFSTRVRVSRWRKMWLALRALPTRMGWDRPT